MRGKNTIMAVAFVITFCTVVSIAVWGPIFLVIYTVLRL